MNSSSSIATSGPSNNDELGDQIAKLAAHIHAATYRFLVMIREFDQREAWADMGSTSCAHWLNWRCGMSVHTAREKLRVAHALTALPKISDAFEQGRLSFSKVRAVTRVATSDNETILLNIALAGTAAQIERVVRCEMRCELEADVIKRTEAAFEQRKFGWCKQADGSVVFHGRLPAELAEKLIAAIDANCKTGNQHVPAGTSESSGLTEESAETPAEESIEESTELRTSLPARRADALIALCESHCEGYEVTVHVPAGTSLHANSLKNSGTIPQASAERLCCDAAMVPVREDEYGHLLDIGRRTRTIPPAIRRALDIRDKATCRFPGCTHTHYLHGHHIQHWAHGGKTCLDNLVLLCSKHHSLVHEGGFGCRAVQQRSKQHSSKHRCSKPRVSIVFSTPTGVVIPDAFSLAPVEGLLEQQHDDFNINAYSCVAIDAGSSLDTSVVIDALSRFRK